MNKINCALLIFAGFLLLSVGVAAQDNIRHKKDSLRNLIATADSIDKLKAYHKLTDIYFMESGADSLKMDTLLYLYNRMFDEAGRQGNINYQGSARVNAIMAFSNREEYNEIFKLAPEYREYFDGKEAWNYYYSLGHSLIAAHLFTGAFETGLSEAQKMYEHAKEHGNNRGTGLALYGMSNAYAHMSRHREEEEHMRRSIEFLKQETALLPYLASAYFYLCQSLLSQKRYEDILTETKEFERINHLYEEKSRSRQLVTWTNLYRILLFTYSDMGDWDNAEIYCRKLEDMNISLNTQKAIADGWAAIYEGRRQYEKALEMLDREIMLFDESNPVERNNISKRKARVLAQMGKAQEVYDLYTKIYNFSDSIRDTEFNARLDELRTRHDVYRLEADNKLISIEKQRNRNNFLFALGGCVLLAVALGIWIRYSRTIVRKNRELVRKNQQWAGIESVPQADADEVTREVTREAESGPAGEIDEIDKAIMNGVRKALDGGLYKDCRLTLDMLAEQLGHHPNLVSSVINRCTGHNFKTCLNEYRVKEVIRMLSDSALSKHISIDTIAFDAGFNDRSNFYRVFRKITGLSPGDFVKNQNRNQ